MIDYIVNELILKPAFKIPQTGLAKALNSLADYKIMTPTDMIAAKAIGAPIKLFYK